MALENDTDQLVCVLGPIRVISSRLACNNTPGFDSFFSFIFCPTNAELLPVPPTPRLSYPWFSCSAGGEPRCEQPLCFAISALLTFVVYQHRHPLLLTPAQREGENRGAGDDGAMDVKRCVLHVENKGAGRGQRESK